MFNVNSFYDTRELPVSKNMVDLDYISNLL